MDWPPGLTAVRSNNHIYCRNLFLFSTPPSRSVKPTTTRGTEMCLPIWLRLWGALGTGMFNVKVMK